MGKPRESQRIGKKNSYKPSQAESHPIITYKLLWLKLNLLRGRSEAGGADLKESAKALFDSVIKEIDYEIPEILGVSYMKVEELRTMKLMMERRLARAEESEAHTEYT